MDDIFRVQDENNHSLRLKRKRHQQWVESSFLDPYISDEQSQDFAKTDGFLGTILTPRRFKTLFVIIVFGLLINLGRAAQLQFLLGAEYQELSQSNRFRTHYIRADRGLIYDRFFIPLVRNIPNYTVNIQARLLPNDREIRQQLLVRLYQDYFIHYLDQSLDQFLIDIENIYQDRYKNDKPIPIVSFLNQDHAILLQIRSGQIPSLSVELLSQREYLNEGPILIDADDTTIYPAVKSLSHSLGYLTSLQAGEYEEKSDKGYLYNDIIGRTGLEAFYETELRGQHGIKQIEVNAMGQFKQVLAQETAIDGKSLLTSIDVEMQRFAEEILQRHLNEAKKEKGSIVIMNPKSGEILTLISLPTFDNNLFSKGISADQYQTLLNDERHPLFFRAIAGEYPSGSTFKPIIAASALQEGLITPNTSFISTGGIRINTWFFPDWKSGGHGITNIYKALYDSVNTYFYIVGGGYNNFNGLGVEKISNYAEQFGLNQILNLDLPGEKTGFLPSKEWKERVKQERWYIGDTYHLSIGQGDILITPLQLTAAISVFANGGILYKPHLVTAFIDKNLAVLEEIPSQIIRKDFIDVDNIKIIQTALKQVITKGSGRRLSTLPISVSGKTGTAQWHSEKDPHAWFTGYAPSDSPQIVFSVMVEEGNEGSGISLSITQELLEWWYKNRYE